MAKHGKSAKAFSLPMPSANDNKGGLDKYEVEDAARTIVRHHEIKANKKLHRAAKAHLKRKHKLEERAIKEE